MNWWRYTPKPSVHERRRRAQRVVHGLAKNGRKLSPVVIEGRKIASSFWGSAWCDNLESYRDFEYRLPRGRSYVRNGAVLDLGITAGKITALVSGSDVYEIEIGIKPLPQARWSTLKSRCAGQLGSLIELLEGRLSEPVMRIITDPDEGLFPKPGEIQMSCSCPDVARMCKHVAAVLYGVGARLDSQPELLFLLRHVDQAELITGAAELDTPRAGTSRKTLAAEELGDVFGIELAPQAQPAKKKKQPTATKAAAKAPRRAAQKAVKKRPARR